jgi:hypothetical protein
MKIDMNSYKEINEFFDSYIDWIGDLFPDLSASHPMKDSEADQMIRHQYSIFKSDALKTDIVEIYEKSVVPDYYICFLISYCYRSLEVPLFEFPSTHPDDNLSEIKSDIRSYVEYGLIPFASDKSGTGSYCIDLMQDAAVVFYKNNERPVKSINKSKIAASFLSLLVFLKEYLDWGGNINGLDADDKLEALTELKGVDPVISASWDSWWLPRLLGNS